jgi:hypothetical protein
MRAAGIDLSPITPEALQAQRQQAQPPSDGGQSSSGGGTG